MTKTKLPLRYAAAVRSIHNILDAQPGGGSHQMFGPLKMLLAMNYHGLDEQFVYWIFTTGLQTFDI